MGPTAPGTTAAGAAYAPGGATGTYAPGGGGSGAPAEAADSGRSVLGAGTAPPLS